MCFSMITAATGKVKAKRTKESSDQIIEQLKRMLTLLLILRLHSIKLYLSLLQYRKEHHVVLLLKVFEQ